MQLPKDFIERTKLILGDEWDDFASSLQMVPPISIRINESKVENDLLLEDVKWCDMGYYLPQRPSFTFDPLLHAGAYYVQEASSMFVEYALKQLVSGEVRCLDLCAAPGGKSTIVSNHISRGSLLVSNEIVRSRANVLAENLMKWGNGNSIVTNNKPDDFSGLTHFFDLILVDAPCSGEGMFRKDPQAIDEWSVANVRLCAERQKDILRAVWSALKPDGYLFYSTCTYNNDENEDIVGWMCDTFAAEVVELPIKEEWGITLSEVKGRSTYHFFPHQARGEGFFFAVLQKRGAVNDSFTGKKDKGDKKRKRNFSFEYKDYLKQPDDYSFSEENGMVYAFPVCLTDTLFFLNKSLNIIHKGIGIGEIKGRDLIPHQSLALSNDLNPEAFVAYDTDWRTAISYLKREALILGDAPKGILLLTYKNRALGFVKNLGNRANNLYPNEWRIRSSALPENEVTVL